MKKETKSKFYMFNQNNSGGFCDVDTNVCHRVVIEAIDENHAKSIFEPMIENQSSSCDCCGNRWSSYNDEIILSEVERRGYSVGIYSHHKNAEERWFKLYGKFPRITEPAWEDKVFKKFVGNIYFDSIEQYCQFMADEYGYTTPDIIIHFLDGTKKSIFKTPKED